MHARRLGRPELPVSPEPIRPSPTRKSYAAESRERPRAGPLFVGVADTGSGDRRLLSASDDRIRVQVGRCRTVWVTLGSNMTFMVPIPLDARAERHGHRRQKRHGQGEARQVRLHGTTLWLCAKSIVTGGRAVSRGRSLALRPRLTTGLPWTMAIEGTDLRSVLEESAGPWSRHHGADSPMSHRPCGSVPGRTDGVGTAADHRAPRCAARGRACRPRWRPRRRRRSGRRRR